MTPKPQDLDLLIAILDDDGPLRRIAQAGSELLSRPDSDLAELEPFSENDTSLAKFYSRLDAEVFTLSTHLCERRSKRPAYALPPSFDTLMQLLDDSVFGVPVHLLKGVPKAFNFRRLHALRSMWSKSNFDDLETLNLLMDFESTSSRRNILLLLKECNESLQRSNTEGHQKVHLERTEIEWTPPPGIGEIADKVFQNLADSRNHEGCQHCGHPEMRLSLGTYRSAVEMNQYPEFDVLLPLDQKTPWLEAKVIAAYREENREKNSDEGISAAAAVTVLCEPLHAARKAHIQLRLLAKENGLWQLPTKRLSRLQRTISLGQLLMNKATTFTGETKRVLSVMLGYTLFHLCDGPWLENWSSNSIHFSQIGASVPLKPYISAKSRLPDGNREPAHPDGSNSSAAFERLNDFLHHPSLLALAIMIMELDIGMPLRDFIVSPENRDVFPDGFAEDRLLELAEDVFNSRKGNMYPCLRSAVNACINLSWDPKLDADPEEFRKEIYKKVLLPLECDLQIFCDSKLRIDIDKKATMLDLGCFGFRIPTHGIAMEMEPQHALITGMRDLSLSVTASPENTDPLTTDSPLECSGGRSGIFAKDYAQSSVLRAKSTLDDDMFQLFNDSDEEDDPSKVKGSEKWITNFLGMIDSFNIEDNADPTRRVKIAILDTGIHLDHDIMRLFRNRIKEIRCWANGGGSDGVQQCGDEYVDESGHGTHIAGILLRMAPHADVYVARVTMTKNFNQPDRIAKAIIYACEEWKVDIISISFGFEKRVASIAEAIEVARQHCLIFAAASNDGNNRDRTYPAEHEGVIRVYATNHFGKPCDFNPPPMGSESFSILGEALKSAWPGDPGESKHKVMSGTSFATPVAAALGAFLLEFAKQRIGIADLLQRLKKSEDMRKLLKHVAGQPDEHGYRYLVPWNYFQIRQGLEDGIIHALR